MKLTFNTGAPRAFPLRSVRRQRWALADTSPAAAAEASSPRQSFRSPGTAEHDHHVGRRACHQVRHVAARQSRSHQAPAEGSTAASASLRWAPMWPRSMAWPRGRRLRRSPQPARRSRFSNWGGCIPNRLSYTTGNQNYAANVFDAALYFQDDWKVNPVPDLVRRPALRDAESYCRSQRLWPALCVRLRA